jgi:uncharacterized protein (UPF0305 family)
MYRNELLNSLKIEASHINENDLEKKLEIINLDIIKNNSISKMEMLLKYNIETMLELKHKTISEKAVVIDEIKIDHLKSAINAYMDKYAQGNEDQKTFIRLVSVYLTFIANKPLHPAGMFDHEGRVSYKNGQVVCPLRKKEIKEPGSLCHFCVSLA